MSRDPHAKDVIIIGAGIGGLATANLLAKAGYNVHVYEKELIPGGRAGRFSTKGFTFDTGPSWYLMPEVFKHYYNLLDTSAADQLDLIKLTPAYKVFFESKPPITVTGDIETDAASFEAVEVGAGQSLRKYVSKSTETYQLALKHFLYSNFTRPTDLLHPDILKRAFQFSQLAFTPIHSYVRRFVIDLRLQQLLEYPMVFLGTSPFKAPALYSLMSALDFSEGVFYPKGTMYAVVESLVKLGSSLGVTYHFDAPVARIASSIDGSKGHATGIELVSGEKLTADIVISNADLHFTETKLLEPAARSYSDNYWAKQEPSPSALLMYLGVKGEVPEFSHHTLLFVDDWQANFEAIASGVIPEKASLYISKTSQTDTTAPAGHENIFVLVPLPADTSFDSAEAERLSLHYLEQIKTMTGVDLASRIVTKTLFGPDDFRTKYHAWRASMLGPSHKLGQSAFFRTPNVSKKLNNLYYVGGGTVPGVGVPMCLIGAELVYKRVIGDTKGGPVNKVIDRISPIAKPKART